MSDDTYACICVHSDTNDCSTKNDTDSDINIWLNVKTDNSSAGKSSCGPNAISPYGYCQCPTGYFERYSGDAAKEYGCQSKFIYMINLVYLNVFVIFY